MRIGNFLIIRNLHRKPRKYQDIDLQKVEECTNQLNKLLADGYVIYETYVFEAGFVHELVKF